MFQELSLLHWQD